ncbi:MAG: hypothetical protein AMXMBFR7_02230 [Planctomycetota bacterium]
MPAIDLPWNLEHLQTAPSWSWWGDAEADGLRGLTYTNETYRGRSSRVFAWYGRPKEAREPAPAMVLVHGGGGKAFGEWVRLWVARGYAALAMDLGGCGPDGQRLLDGGPGQDHDRKFMCMHEPPESHWCFHALAAVMRANSLLRSFHEIDPVRVGVTGISWGGFLTCLAAGLDPRFALAMPVYGCGFIHENSSVDWLAIFAKLPAEQRERWVRWYDPSSHLSAARLPMLFVNGTNDFAYPLDSYMKTFGLPAGHKRLSVRVRMPHGHEHGWAPPELARFADWHLRGGDALTEFGPLEHRGECGFAPVRPASQAHSPQFHFTADALAWQSRHWHSLPAMLHDGVLTTPPIPAEARAWFCTLEEPGGSSQSTTVAIAR